MLNYFTLYGVKFFSFVIIVSLPLFVVARGSVLTSFLLLFSKEMSVMTDIVVSEVKIHILTSLLRVSLGS